VAHACKPSYSGGKEQEDQRLKAWANSSQAPVLKKKNHKKGLMDLDQVVRVPALQV
jgi:hypothetical protein